MTYHAQPLGSQWVVRRGEEIVLMELTRPQAVIAALQLNRLLRRL